MTKAASPTLTTPMTRRVVPVAPQLRPQRREPWSAMTRIRRSVAAGAADFGYCC